jgi:hypothetical protein
MKIHMHTLPYQHLRKTEPVAWILKLMKSPQMPRCQRKRRLPLDEYFVFMRHTYVKLEVWTLVGWGYNHPPNHPNSDWFSIHWHFTCMEQMILPLSQNYCPKENICGHVLVCIYIHIQAIILNMMEYYIWCPNLASLVLLNCWRCIAKDSHIFLKSR